MIEIGKYDIIKLFADIFKSYGVNAYLVGGAVRDLLLNIDPIDFDFVIEIDGQRHYDIAKDISQRLNCSCDYNKDYNTAKFNYNGYDIDFVMARKEYYDGIAAKPRVYSSSLSEDLKRRDYTINSMAIPLCSTGEIEIMDPLNGRTDLDNKTIRVLHSKSFRDDPTRVIRGVKYAGRFGFDFDRDTSNLIDDCIDNGYISYLSPGRIKQQIFTILEETLSLKSFEFIKRYKIIDKLVNDNVKINLDLNQQIFNTNDNNRKLVVLLYQNNLDTLNKIKSALNLGKNIIEYCCYVKEIERVLNCNDEDLYKYIFRNQNKIDEKILATIFYKDIRFQNYFKFKDKIKIDKKYLADVDKIQIEKVLVDKKVSMLYMYLNRGEEND